MRAQDFANADFFGASGGGESSQSECAECSDEDGESGSVLDHEIPAFFFFVLFVQVFIDE